MQLDGSTPLWLAARVLLHERGYDFFRRWKRAVRTNGLEDIHDLRVASRRLREGLALFDPCYPSGNLAPLVKRVRKVTKLLGETRNTDEALLFFTGLAEELGPACRDDLAQLLASYGKERKKGLRRLKSGLREMTARLHLERYLRITSHPSLFTPPANGLDLFAPLSGFARDALQARLSTVVALVPQATQADNIDAQHRLRIAVKHFRYRMEILSFLIGGNFEELRGALKSYQDLLGKMHDLDVFADIVRDWGFPPQVGKLLLDAMIAKRESLFDDFAGMLKTVPFEKIGMETGSAL